VVTTLDFTVYGMPAPQGSKRHVGKGVMVESSKKVAPWREDVKHAALHALDTHPSWNREARSVCLVVVFYLPRPRSHYRTGHKAHLMRANAPDHVSTKPDLDKLLRSTGDALGTAGVYRDDSCLAVVVASKVYTPSRVDGAMDRPGAQIQLHIVPELVVQ
jgi:Holliday junction resolvase RusA-like endonuclease